MNKATLTMMLVAAAALAGCDQSDHTINAAEPFDPQANAVANGAAVVLPPSIVASHPYRCKDNSLVTIEWLSDGKANSARATPEGGTAISLAQAEAAGPYTAADGTSLTGDPQAKTVTYKGQSCTR